MRAVASWISLLTVALYEVVSPLAAPLTLQDAIRLARDHHPAIEAQRGQRLAALGREQQALARLLPFVEGTFAYQPTTPNLVPTPPEARALLRSTGQDTVVDAGGMPTVVTCRSPSVGNCAPIPPSATIWTPQSFWLAQVGLTWTAWDWGRSIHGYRGARDLTAAADVGVRAAELDVTLQVELAFFAVLTADQQVTVADDAVKTYQAHLAQTKTLHASGLRTGIDVATAESAEASAEISLARTRAARETARAQLQVALGVDEWRDWTLVIDPATFELQSIDEQRAEAPVDVLVATASKQRPDLEELRLEERGQGASVQSTRGSYLPQLTLSLSPEWAGPALSSLTPNLTFMVGLGYPTGGMSPLLVHGQTREAEGSLVGVRAQRRAALEAARAETLTARASLAAARDSLAFARVLAEAAARQRGLAEGRYQTGVGNVIELYDALLTDVNARFQLVQARLDLATARVRMQHALGEGP
ncbi:MAG TPA: TolC family protein [Polyangia bacterium]